MTYLKYNNYSYNKLCRDVKPSHKTNYECQTTNQLYVLLNRGDRLNCMHVMKFPFVASSYKDTVQYIEYMYSTWSCTLIIISYTYNIIKYYILYYTSKTRNSTAISITIHTWLILSYGCRTTNQLYVLLNRSDSLKCMHLKKFQFVASSDKSTVQYTEYMYITFHW